MLIKRMMLAAVALFAIHAAAQAQTELFGSVKEPSRKGLIIGANGNLDIPGGDLAKRFGLSFRIGPSLMYKTETNWMFGIKADFIFGNKIKEDSLLIGVRDANFQFINNEGQRISVGIYERGYLIGVQAGKIFPINKAHPNSGWLVMTGAGFVQHKITIFDDGKSIPQLRDDYRKGYDRLTNGWFVEQFLGYNMFDKSGLINFHIGLNLMAGFTKGRRDFLYDVMRKDDASRIDLLFGIRGGWYIPVFKKKSEEIFFE